MILLKKSYPKVVPGGHGGGRDGHDPRRGHVVVAAP